MTPKKTKRLSGPSLSELVVSHEIKEKDSPAYVSGWPGSKGAAGLYQRIIRQMPPHKTYIEGFAGADGFQLKHR